MDISNVTYEITVNNEIIKSIVNLNENCTSAIANGALLIDFSLDKNMLNISIKNNGSKAIGLNSLSLKLLSARHYKEGFCIINPKKTSEKITYMPMAKVTENEKIHSHLFEIFVDEENFNSKIFGFLGCQFSKNYIENVSSKNELKITAVYNFISQTLEPGEELVLDSIYMREGKNIFSLFNSFLDRVIADFEIKEEYGKKLVLKKSNSYSVLFTYKVNSSTLKINDKPVYLKVDGKKLYAVDISSPEGKEKVFTNANAVLSRANALNLDGVGAFIDIIEANKLFNVNCELSKVLALIKNQFEGVRFFSNDYPLGLIKESVIVDNKELTLEDKKGLLSILGKKNNNHHVNYDFFLKLLMQRVVSYCNQDFSVSNKKVKELMSIALGSGNISVLSNGELMEMAEDIDIRNSIIPYIEKKKTFALLFTGRKYMYLAVFNLESEEVKFYCDLSVHSGYKELDGVVEEVYSNTNYLIVDGKLYIRNLPSMDCCLFKKKIEYKGEAV